MKNLLTFIPSLIYFSNLLFTQQFGEIRGTVYDRETNNPLPAVSVIIVGATLGSITDVNGNYVIKNVKPGVYKVEAKIVGYDLQTKNVTIRPGKTTLDFYLSPIKTSPGKLSGYMFGDFYYVFTNHRSDYEKQNGFWFRRIYFTYDYNISENFMTRFRLEFNSPDFKENPDNIKPYIKDAYLEWKFGEQSLFFGLSPTPTWELIEKHWGYRSVEKTPLDLQKLGNSRDLGIALLGAFGENLKYHFMIGNGEGTKSEFNKYKKIYLSLSFYPTDNFFIEVYGDWTNAERTNQVYTYQGFLGFKSKKMRLGLQFAGQKKYGGSSLRVASGFFTFDFVKDRALILRFDKMFDENPAGENFSYLPFASTAPSNLIIAGVDFKLDKNVSIIPNVEYVFYDKKNGNRPKSDLYARLTFFYQFK